MIPGKVAALITRHVGGRTELCVFDHAGFVQLPAGTLEVGEAPAAGVAREAWEETGLPHLEVVGLVAELDEYEAEDRPDAEMMVAPHDGCPITPGHTVRVHERVGATATISSEYHAWTGTVDAACVSRDITRSVFHLRTTTPTPDEWWVLTPDGDTCQWRCRWVDVDRVDALGPWQQRWHDAGRGRLDPGPEIGPAAPNRPGSAELYAAAPFGDVRLVMTLHERRRPPEGARIGSCYGFCVTAGGDAVLVTQTGRDWNIPGGRLELGETIEEAFVREVGEEACARVVDLELLATSEDLELDDERRVAVHRWTPMYWARVELEEWRPDFEITDRRLVPLDDVGVALGYEMPYSLRLHELAREAEARRKV